MGLLSFIKDAGEKLFGSGTAQAASAPADANAAAAAAIKTYIGAMKLDAEGLGVAFDGSSGTVTVSGTVNDQATREKIVLCCGNVAGVEKVIDNMTVKNPVPEAKFYTVVRGDTLSKIAKEQYGNANAYMTIFEANKPMLTHPDKIYPGQVLRIPPRT
ncbi:MAG: peptidoglycan-binding protein LysM [Burkholderiales bacterium]|nr:peptidoglycan-binding protein LysM [Burkholderiales bacterium]OJX04420.1 MAG: peptidoglycan-binding protein LysM [Burkholderiales bacterium 70-64]